LSKEEIEKMKAEAEANAEAEYCCMTSTIKK